MDENELSYFPCYGWFQSDLANTPMPTTRELHLSNLKENEYEIMTFTANCKGANTDANVYVVVHGESASSSARGLEQSRTHRDKFEIGQTDNFVLKVSFIISSVS